MADFLTYYYGSARAIPTSFTPNLCCIQDLFDLSSDLILNGRLQALSLYPLALLKVSSLFLGGHGGRPHRCRCHGNGGWTVRAVVGRSDRGSGCRLLLVHTRVLTYMTCRVSMCVIRTCAHVYKIAQNLHCSLCAYASFWVCVCSASKLFSCPNISIFSTL